MYTAPHRYGGFAVYKRSAAQDPKHISSYFPFALAATRSEALAIAFEKLSSSVVKKLSISSSELETQIPIRVS